MFKALLIILTITTTAHAQWSLGGGVGFGSYRNDYLDTIDVSTTGNQLFLQAEYRIAWFSIGAEIAKFSSKGQIKHNNVDYLFHQDALQYGGYGKLHLLNFFFRLGYTFNSASSYITDFPGDAQEQTGTVLTTYSTQANSESSSGTHFGIGFTYPIPVLPSVDFLVDADRYSWFDGTGSSFVFKLGFVYNFGGGGGGGAAAAN